MSKKVLAIGGSYFIGRVFSILTSRDDSFELTVLNRGSHPLRLDNVTELVCDRHDTAKLAELLEGKHFDAVVDFCAYNPQEARSMMFALEGHADHYICLSTCSVLGEGKSELLDETAPVIRPAGDDQVARYVQDKIDLEDTIAETSVTVGIPYTIIRPAFVYGPFNYAPRESWFIRLIVSGNPVPALTDATARISFTYVYDITYALHAIIKNVASFGQTYIIAGTEEVTNEGFVDMLQKCLGPFETVPVTVEQVERENIPLPYPLNDDALYDGSKITRDLGLEYTPFEDGMKKTCEVFANVFKAMQK